MTTTIIPDAGSTFLPLQPAATLTPSVDWGLDGRRDYNELEFKAYPPDNDSLNSIAIKLPGFDLSDADDEDQDLIEIYGSADAETGPRTNPIRISVADETLTLILSGGLTLADNEHLIITINQGTGILTPETPRDFDGPTEGYPVAITFNEGPPDSDANNNIVVVENPIETTVPSDRVQVTLALFAKDSLGTGDEITVDFSGPSPDSSFVVPSSITPAKIEIYPDSNPDGIGTTHVDPSEVLVQGQKVILTVPAGPDDDPIITITGDYTIRFMRPAGIKNPFSAGNPTITVSSRDNDDPDDEITAVIIRTTTIDPLEGPRGETFTLNGKGYAKGTVTVYHDANGNQTVDAGETLATEKTRLGAFKVTLEARGKPRDPTYIVRTKDSYVVDDVVTFTITSAMSFAPATVGVGDRVRVLIADWEDDDDDGVSAVRVGGRMALMLDRGGNTGCYADSSPIEPDDKGMITIDIEVPRNVPAGEQTVSVYGPNTTVALLNPAVTAVVGSGIAVPVPDGAVSTETITEQAQWDDSPSIPSG